MAAPKGRSVTTAWVLKPKKYEPLLVRVSTTVCALVKGVLVSTLTSRLVLIWLAAKLTVAGNAV